MASRRDVFPYEFLAQEDIDVKVVSIRCVDLLILIRCATWLASSFMLVSVHCSLLNE